MKKTRLSRTTAAVALMFGFVLPADATSCNPGEPCDITTTSHTSSAVHNSTSNAVYTGFSRESREAGLRLKSVYTTVESLSEKNTGKICAKQDTPPCHHDVQRRSAD